MIPASLEKKRKCEFKVDDTTQVVPDLHNILSPRDQPRKRICNPNESKTTHSPLLTLPGELRNIIYNHYFETPSCTCGQDDLWCARCALLPNPLTQVCQQIRAETYNLSPISINLCDLEAWLTEKSWLPQNKNRPVTVWLPMLWFGDNRYEIQPLINLYAQHPACATDLFQRTIPGSNGVKLFNFFAKRVMGGAEIPSHYISKGWDETHDFGSDPKFWALIDQDALQDAVEDGFVLKVAIDKSCCASETMLYHATADTRRRTDPFAKWRRTLYVNDLVEQGVVEDDYQIKQLKGQAWMDPEKIALSNARRARCEQLRKMEEAGRSAA